MLDRLKAFLGIDSETKPTTRELNKVELQQLITRIQASTDMVPAKKVLLLKNLQDQLTLQGNEVCIQQIQGRPYFDYRQRQIFKPQLRSNWQQGFFSLEDGTADADSAIIDFANDRFGGGVIGPRGFAQEEKLLLETNLIPEAGDYQNLTRDPLYIQALQTHQFVGAGKSVYGNSKMGANNCQTIDNVDINPGNLPQYFQSLSPPRQVNIIAMAALDIGRLGYKEYTIENYQQMFETAYKAFQAHQINGGKTVHSGAWGAGVFRNSENVTCVIQILAAQAAGLQLIYHGSQPAYESALRFLRGPHVAGKDYTTVFKSMQNYMQRQHSSSSFWRPQ
jgi:hypothetical protein